MSKSVNDSSASKFVTRKWIEVNDLLGGQNSTNKNIKFITLVRRSDLCDYSVMHIYF